MFDRLTDRTLPTAGVTASLAGGVLTVVGTESADQILLDVSGPTRFRRSWTPGTLTVQGVGSYRLNQISAVLIYAGGGDDLVRINDQGRLSAPVFTVAGDGNDTILGGYGMEYISGGDGNDVIGTFNYADVIDGGTGLNWINGTLAYVPPPTTSAPAVEATSAQAPSKPAPVATRPAPAPSSPSSSSSTPVSIPAQATASTPDLQSWAQQIVNLTNQQRTANGLSPLTVNTRLTQAAQLQANQMASLRFMAHTLPTATYPDLQSRAAAAGYRYSWLGENIAFNYPDPQGVMNAWMLSSEHRANILEPNYTEIGVAVALDANGLPYFAQEFGKPA